LLTQHLRLRRFSFEDPSILPAPTFAAKAGQKNDFCTVRKTAFPGAEARINLNAYGPTEDRALIRTARAMERGQHSAAWRERLASAWQRKTFSGSLHSASVATAPSSFGRDDKCRNMCSCEPGRGPATAISRFREKDGPSTVFCWTFCMVFVYNSLSIKRRNLLCLGCCGGPGRIDL
jgi:hypothetical protein